MSQARGRGLKGRKKGEGLGGAGKGRPLPFPFRTFLPLPPPLLFLRLPRRLRRRLGYRFRVGKSWEGESRSCISALFVTTIPHPELLSLLSRISNPAFRAQILADIASWVAAKSRFPLTYHDSLTVFWQEITDNRTERKSPSHSIGMS